MSVKPSGGPPCPPPRGRQGCGRRAAGCRGRRRPGRLRAKRCPWSSCRPGTGGGTAARPRRRPEQSTWSWRFFPTPGRWTRTSMPRPRSSSPSPIPDSSSSFGDSIVPQHTTTSCSAWSDSTAPVADDLDADAARALEEQPPGAGTHQHRETLRVERPVAGTRSPCSRARRPGSSAGRSRRRRARRRCDRR